MVMKSITCVRYPMIGHAFQLHQNHVILMHHPSTSIIATGASHEMDMTYYVDWNDSLAGPIE